MSIDTKLGQRLEALPVHSPAQHARLSLDPRLAQEFLRSGDLPSGTKQQLTQYIITAKWSAPERAVYGAVVEGFTSIEQLETVTGMSASKVQSTVGKLEKRGVLRKVSSV